MAYRHVKWVRQWGGYDQIVWVNVAKLDAYWRRERFGYIRKNGKNSQYKYGRVAESIERYRKLWMPHIGFYFNNPNKIGFTDGRHRFAWMRDHGAKAMPVTTTKADAKRMEKLIGTKRRICRVQF